MRMWNVDPRLLCRKHLLGEHVEMHMMIGTINAGKSCKGYTRDGLIEIHNVRKRHDQLRDEMFRRGYNHNSPLPEAKLWVEGKVDVDANIIELHRRCPDCRKIADYGFP